MTVRQGHRDLPFTADQGRSDLPSRQGRRGLPCRPSRSRGTDRLRVYFGIFDRIFQKKSSTPSSSSIFSLCPLCSLVARSKTGGEYKLVADQWTSSNSSLQSWATYSFNSKGTSIFVLNRSSGVGMLFGNIFAIFSILRCIVSKDI